MIEVRDVVKTFDGFRALDGVTMTVPRGAVYGLVGPNGAGKSTLIRHLTGIYRPDSGVIDIDGQPVYENPAVKARIAYIPDDVFYFPQATIPDMMRYYRGIFRRRTLPEARRGVSARSEAADPPPVQGYAEAGRVLAGNESAAGRAHP